MTVSLLRRDPAFHRLPKWLAVTVANVLGLLGLRAWIIAARGADQAARLGDLVLLALALWVPLAIYLIYVGHRPRYNRMDLGLPVASRHLWLVHLLAVVLCGLIIITLASAVVELNSRGMRSWLGASEAVVQTGLVGVLPQIVTVLVLAAVLYQSIQPARRKLAADPQLIAIDLAIAGGLFGLLVLLCAVPLGWSLLPLGAALFLAWRAYRDLPPALDLAPESRSIDVAVGRGAGGAATEVTGDAGGGTAAATSELAVDGTMAPPTAGEGRRILAGTVLRTCYGTLKLLTFFPFLGIIGLMVSGLLFSHDGREDRSLMFVPLIWYFLVAYVPLSLRRLHLLDAWPVSRHTLFAMLVLPGMILLAASYGLGHLLLTSKLSYRERIRYELFDGDHYVMVPLDHYEIAWNGDPDVITAPWGETQAPYELLLLKGIDAVIYKPFTNGPTSSRKFVAWQISRAAQAIYGAELTPAEISHRYLEKQSDGRIVPRAGMLTIASDHPQISPRWQGQWFPVVMLVICVPWLLMLAWYLRAYGAGMSTTQRRVTQIGFMVGSMGLYLAGPALDIAGVGDIRNQMALLKILTRHLVSCLPGDVFMLWVLVGAIIFAAYRLAQRQFLRCEIPLAEAREVE